MEHAFIRVPETHLPCGLVVPPFEVSAFLCSPDPDSRVPRAASQVFHTPLVRVSYFAALAACRAAGWSLITETQWLAIAHDAAGQNANWTGGQFGQGKLKQGLRKRSVLAPVSGMYQPEDAAESRWKTLSNGQALCDFGGNAWSWVYDDVQGGPEGVTGVVDADSPSVMTAPCNPRTSGMGLYPHDAQGSAQELPRVRQVPSRRPRRDRHSEPPGSERYHCPHQRRMAQEMKPVIIYHDSCADGFGAAFAAWLKFGKEAIYIPCQHGKGKPATIDDMCALFDKHGVPSGKNIQLFILDFSFDKPIMDWLLDVMGHVVWLDHHKSAFEMWCGKYEKGMQFSDTNGCYGDGNFDIILDDNNSGALLAWQWFHSILDVPLAFFLIDDYDRWQFKFKGTKAFQKALWSYAPWTFESWTGMDLLNDRAVEQLVVQGVGILRAHEQHVAKTVKEATMHCKLSTYTADSYGAIFEGLAANCPPFLQSDVGHELATKSDTFGLLWCIDKDGQCKCSLRSNGDYDVAAIAKAFGGGGHQNAAGFTVPIETLLGWLE